MSHMTALEGPDTSTANLKSDSSAKIPDLLRDPDPFLRRHIGPNQEAVGQMLRLCGFDSLEALVNMAVPSQIRLGRRLDLPEGRSEHDVLNELKAMASRNQIFRSYIGMGYYDC